MHARLFGTLEYKNLTLISRIQDYQILTNDDEVCIPSLSSVLLAVKKARKSDVYIKEMAKVKAEFH